MLVNLFSWLLGWIPEILKEGQKTNMPKTSYVVIILMLWLFLATIGSFFYFAKASDQQSLGQKIQGLSDAINISARLQIASRIRELAAESCGTKDQKVRERNNAAIDRLQIEYQKVDSTQSMYLIPPCDSY